MLQVLRRSGLAAACAAGLLAAAPVAFAQEAEPTASGTFSPAEEDAIRALVRDYLVNHPEVLIEALQVYQDQQRIAEQERRKEAITQRWAQLNEDATSPVLGNPDGDVVVIEFFDYRCGYCKSVSNQLRRAVLEDGNVRLVMKEFPILGPESRIAAQAALASVKQDGYEDFHFALMNHKGRMAKEDVLALAEKQGLDRDQLAQDMLDPEINSTLRRNYALAQSLEISGTPAFVIGDQLVPGALSMDQLRHLIEEQRRQSS